jgi:hypothetical protein
MQLGSGLIPFVVKIVALGDQRGNFVPHLENVQRACGQRRDNCHNQTNANQHGLVTSVSRKVKHSRQICQRQFVSCQMFISGHLLNMDPKQLKWLLVRPESRSFGGSFGSGSMLVEPEQKQKRTPKNNRSCD